MQGARKKRIADNSDQITGDEEGEEVAAACDFVDAT